MRIQRTIKLMGRDVCMMKKRMLIIIIIFAIFTSPVFSKGQQDSKADSGDLKIATYTHIRDLVHDWDPAIESSEGNILFMNVYETLLLYTPETDTFKNVLATDYQKSEDGKTWTFKLREGVKFHDGTDFNSEAVKFSIERYIEIDKGLSFIWAPIDSVETPDEYTVVFKLKYAAPMDLIVSSGFCAYIISPSIKSHPEGWLTEGNEIGTGPYMLEKWNVEQVAVLTQFSEYWGGWEDNQFDKVVIRTVAESTTRRQMIESGESDITGDLTTEDYEALEDNTDIYIDTTTSYKNLFIAVNTKKEPFTDIRIRQALAYLFPYDDAIQYAAGGFATQARGPVPHGMWSNSDKVLQYRYDPDKALLLLKEAGFPDGGFEVKAVHVTGSELQRKSLELYKAELAKYGIELTIRTGPWSSIWGKAKGPNPPQDMYIMHWWPTYVDPYDFLYSLLRSQEQAHYNLSYWSNEEYDKLIDSGTATSAIDRDKATQMYIDAQNIAMREMPLMPLMDLNSVVAMRSTFKGYKNNAAYNYVVFFYDCYRE